MALSQAEQAELEQLRSELGYGPLGEPIPGVTVPTYSPEETKKTAKELAAEASPMLGAIVAPLFGPANVPIRMGLSALGAGVGTAGKQAIETYGLGLPWTVGKMAMEYPKEMALGAVGEGAGQLIGRGISKISNLFSKPVAATDELASKQQVQGMLQGQGTTLGIQEAAPDSTLSKIVERISRIGPTKAAVAQDVKFKQALSQEVSDIASTLTDDVLSRSELGAGLMTVQAEGKTALYDSYGKGLKDIMDRGGSAIVDLSPMQAMARAERARASSLLKEGESASQVLGSKGNAEIDSILAFKPEMTFEEANEARKLLLKKQRTYDKGTPEYDLIKKAIGDIQTQMDIGATKLSPSLYKDYQTLSASYKQAIKELDPKILANAATKYPEKVADDLLQNGKVSAWRETEKLLKQAKSLGVETEGLAENVQRAYLEKTFADSGLTNVGKKLQEDKKFAEQFDAVLPEAVKNRAKVVARAGQLLAERGKGVDLQTAAALSSAVGAGAGAAYTGDIKGGTVGAGAGLATLIIAPKIAAKIAYSPTATQKLLQASGEASKGNMSAALVKMAEMYRELKLSPTEMQEVSRPVAPTSLTSQEQEELQRLRQELSQ
jgi:hypothetical protein